MDFSKIYKGIGNKFPSSIHISLSERLRYAGLEANTMRWLGSRILLVFLFSLIGFFGYLSIDKTGYLVALTIFIVLLIIFSILIYVSLFFMIISRTKRVEDALPDFLMLMVSNLHAGMTPFAAFVQAARPEFGPLYTEIKITASRVGGKRSLDLALLTLSRRFQSELFRKTVNLFLKGLKSGGQLAKLLSANAEEIRRIQDLRAELISTTRTYTIFLAFIVVIVMPFLLGVSVSFLNTFIEIKSSVQAPSGGVQTVSIFSGELGITAEEMGLIGNITLIITSLIASLFMGVVSSGKPLYGLKYYVFLVVASIVFFNITQGIISDIVKLGA